MLDHEFPHVRIGRPANRTAVWPPERRAVSAEQPDPDRDGVPFLGREAIPPFFELVRVLDLPLCLPSMPSKEYAFFQGNGRVGIPSVNRCTVPHVPRFDGVDVAAGHPYHLCLRAQEAQAEADMARTARFKRKSVLVEKRLLKRANKTLGAPTDAEVVRLSLERVAGMEEFWRFMQQNRRILKPGSIKSS